MGLNHDIGRIILIGMTLIGCPARAENFTCQETRIVVAAEAARRTSALFWTGKPLPADWSTPCPIQVQLRPHDGGGRTQFQFAHGEVFGWQMNIEGRPQNLLDDVIPHEVDHMVRASLVRHPIERWLDEGCASLFESAAARAQLRSAAQQSPASMIQARWLSRMDYPADSTELSRLYAVGFSLVEFLLTRQDAKTLLAFQTDRSTIEERLAHYYGMSIPELQREWDAWRRPAQATQTALRCQCPNRQLPILVIWTARWCQPCRQFRQQWETDPQLRSAIEQAYHVHLLDYDRHRALAVAQGIKQLPTFITDSQRIQGWTSTAQLLKQLGIGSLEGEHSPPVNLPVPSDSLSQSGSNAPESSRPVPDVDPSETDTVPATPDGSANRMQPESAAISHSDEATPHSAKAHPHNVLEFARRFIPTGLTLLQWCGVLGSSVATGGAAGLALSILPRLLRRRSARHAPQSEGRSEPIPAPFPRKLDEARQLLELRKSEGRVAILDALRGMFLDDEVEKLKQSASPERQAVLEALIQQVDERVDEVAPLSTRLDAQHLPTFSS